MDPCNTNLAAEFYVLSVLHRLGADASLTLGNKKAVDIIVVREAGETITVDVKGLAGPYDWPADNVRIPDHARHFLVLVSFEGQIANPRQLPSIWVVPAQEIRGYLREYKTRRVISRAEMRTKGSCYRDAWSLLLIEERGYRG